jgi:hypothetical protein
MMVTTFLNKTSNNQLKIKQQHTHDGFSISQSAYYTSHILVTSYMYMYIYIFFY